MPQRHWPATPPSILVALLLVAAVPHTAGGQVIRGRLLDAASATGIGGAMASLADRSGQRIDQALTGTMWLDPVSARLARLDFRYVNLDVHPRLMEAAPGGDAEFRTLPNDTWIVPSWHLRMFRPGEAPHPLTGRSTASIAAVIMEHGEVLRVHGERGVVFEADTGRRMAGTVFDTLHVGLPGARVFVNGEGTEVVTDADGRFDLTHLGPYEYAVHFTHPYLERLWHQPEPVEVEVGRAAPNPVRVDFEAPSMEDVLDDVCGPPGPTPPRASRYPPGRSKDQTCRYSTPGSSVARPRM